MYVFNPFIFNPSYFFAILLFRSIMLLSPLFSIHHIFYDFTFLRGKPQNINKTGTNAKKLGVGGVTAFSCPRAVEVVLFGLH